MKKVYVHILKSFSGPMVIAFFIVVFILLMQMLWRYIDDIVGKGLDASVIAEFMFWATLTVIPLALPLSMLFASIMTMGNLGGNNELLALKSAGLSLIKILRPLFFVAALFTLFAFYIADNVMPYAMMKIYSVFFDIKNKRPDAQIIPGVFCDIDDNVIKIATKDPKTYKMTDILLYQHPEGKGNVAVIVADSGYIKTENDNMIVTLYNGISYEDATTSGFIQPNAAFSFQKRTFDKHTLIVDLSKNKLQRTDAELFKSQYTTMKSSELKHLIDSVSETQTIKEGYFWTEFSRSQFLGNTAEIDTSMQNNNANKVNLSKTVNSDSIFNKFSRQQKIQTIQYASEQSAAVSATTAMTLMDISNDEQNIRKASVEWHTKFTLSIACFIFFLIGAPFGAIIRKGGLGMPTVASLLIFITYFIITTITKKMAVQGAMPVAFAMWFADALFLPLGIFLLVKAKNDSALFNAENYMKYLKVLQNLLQFAGINSNIKIKNEQNCYRPSTINRSIADKNAVKEMLGVFNNETGDLLKKLNSGEYDVNDIKDFNKRYDNMLSILWGIDNEKLNEELAKYPHPPDLTILKSGTITLQMLKNLIVKKIEQIAKINSDIKKYI